MFKDYPHVAIFIRSLMDGGVERVILNLAQGFIEQGLRVDLVLTTEPAGPYRSQVPPKVRIVDLQTPKLASSLPKLVSYLRQNQPLTLLSAGHYCCEIASWAKYLSRMPTRVVVSEHSTLSFEVKSTKNFKMRLTPLTARLFYPWADGVVTVSHGVAKDLSQVTGLPIEKIHVIYNPVVTPKMLEKSQESLEHSWLKPEEIPLILGVGRLTEQKDFSTLIHAFNLVQQVRPARLMILGNGHERSRLDALIRELGLENHVAILGFQKNPYAYMAKASVFALSSAWEGLPTVLVEAMALGTPVVSTDCESGPAEILAHGKYGSLVPVGNSEAMAEAILKVLSGNFPTVDPNWIEQFTLTASTLQYLKVLNLTSS
jgi:glycosyltransferase involved in cell wall biosynthesis